MNGSGPASSDRPVSSDRSGPGAVPAWRRRSSVVLATVLLALTTFGITTQTWLTVRFPQEAVQTPDLSIPGSDAATAVSAFALVALAAALAVSISGPVARWIIAAVVLAAGAGVAWNSFRVLTDPDSAAVPAIGEAIGVSSGSGASVTGSPLPWLAAAAGVLLMLAAVWIILAGRGWARSRRYESGHAAATSPGAPATTHSDGIDSWDALSKGEDPTR